MVAMGWSARACVAGAVLFALGGFVSGARIPGVSLGASLLLLATCVWAVRELVVRSRSLRVHSDSPPAAALDGLVDEPGEDPGDVERFEEIAPGHDPPMTYGETLEWLLAHLGRPVGVTMRAQLTPYGAIAPAPTMRAKGRLRFAQPDELADQDVGERLEFAIGRAAFFSVGEPEFFRAEGAEEGALIQFVGASTSIVVLEDEAILDVEAIEAETER